MASPRIGLALGSGAARGWSHIGVIEALAEAGIEPDMVSYAAARWELWSGLRT
jgi:NTE family protein